MRSRLPNRRPCEILDFTFRSKAYTLLVGRFADGRIAEAFVEPMKVASDVAEASRDAGIIISIALQSGVPLETLRCAVSRVENGRPGSLTGHVLDILAARTAAGQTGGAG